MATAQGVIKDFMKFLDNTSLSGTSALDAAVSSVSKFSSWSDLTKTMVNDCKAYNGDYEAFLKDMCNIILDNEDTGAISGSDAGTGTAKGAESIVPESGSINYPSSNVFTIQGLTVTVPELATLSDSEKFIVGALYTWWINESLSLINSSFGMNFSESGTTVKEMDVEFYNSDDGRMAVTSYSTDQKCTELHLKINMHYYDNIDTSNPNGVGNSDALTYLDRTIAHEMVHVVMAANVDYFNNLPTVFKEGIAELVHGIDDKRRDKIQSLAESSSSLQNAFNGSGTSTYAAGYMALRYLAKQAANGRDPADTVAGSSYSDSSSSQNSSSITPSVSTSTSTTIAGSATFSNSGKTLTVRGDFEEDIWLSSMDMLKNKTSAYANVDTMTIDATQLTSRIIMVGNDNNNTIKSGRGGASVWGGTGGDDVLVGGSSRDVFFYSSSNGTDVVKNFTAGNGDDDDVLAVTDGNFYVNRAGSDLVIIMNDGSGTMSVSLTSNVDTPIQYTATGKSPIAVKIGNTDSANNFTYEDNMYYLGGNGYDTLSVNTANSSNSIFLTDEHFSNINVLSAKYSSSRNILAGNYLDNEIIGGSGDSSMWGGEGGSNDVLTGGDSTNMFWYGQGEGNDIINNADSNDSVNLYNISLNDIVSVEDFQSGLKINMSSGSLTINATETPKCMLADGTAYRYDRNNSNWYESSD